jgi:hypothetical protein
MDRFDDGIEEWREGKASDPDHREQRKANYTPPEMRHEKALEFIERESKQGGGFSKLIAQALWRIRNGEHFDTDYEIKNIKYVMVRRGECTAKEAKEMFKGATASTATVTRELILRIPELAEYARIRACDISQFYPQLKYLEKSAAINVEDGGDFAA